MEETFHKFERHADVIGTMLVKMFHLLALFAIGGATVWSAAHSFLVMAEAGKAGLADILLLFIYLELGAMVGIYFKTNRMPVRFLIYVAITALTRLMVEIISLTHEANLTVIMISGAILLLAIAELVLRYGSTRLAIEEGPEEIADRPAARQRAASRRKQGASSAA